MTVKQYVAVYSLLDDQACQELPPSSPPPSPPPSLPPHLLSSFPLAPFHPPSPPPCPS
ncbi:uncharacterized protein LOC129716131, partial [Leucoraja erinacea]|uniref:uncharacterized protein LOC129716131 n=1 Tax=Leucoraja erinaceus TaxID=7782 RepID=UPI0024581338